MSAPFLLSQCLTCSEQHYYRHNPHPASGLVLHTVHWSRSLSGRVLLDKLWDTIIWGLRILVPPWHVVTALNFCSVNLCFVNSISSGIWAFFFLTLNPRCKERKWRPPDQWFLKWAPWTSNINIIWELVIHANSQTYSVRNSGPAIQQLYFQKPMKWLGSTLKLFFFFNSYFIYLFILFF